MSAAGSMQISEPSGAARSQDTRRVPCRCCPDGISRSARVPRCPSDMRAAEWAVIEPTLPAPAWKAGGGGRPAEHCRRTPGKTSSRTANPPRPQPERLNNKLRFAAYCGPTASPAGPAGPEAMTCGLVPSRLASTMVPAAKLAQYRWLAFTATADGSAWPEAMTGGLAPPRLASTLVPAPLLAQYGGLAPPAPPTGSPGPEAMTCGLV